MLPGVAFAASRSVADGGPLPSSPTQPDPKIYRSTCAKLDVAPDAAVFVDDVVECVAGARAIGMQTAHHVDNHQTIAAIEALLADD